MKKLSSHYHKVSLALFALLLPAVSFAQSSTTAVKCSNGVKNLTDIISLFTCIAGRALVPLIFTFALVVFIWGVLQYVMNADNEEKRKKGRSFMIYGIVGLFVMISVWGLVRVLSNTFGIDTFIPQLQAPQ